MVKDLFGDKQPESKFGKFNLTEEENAIIRDKIKEFGDEVLRRGKVDNLEIECLVIDLEEMINKGIEQA